MEMLQIFMDKNEQLECQSIVLQQKIQELEAKLQTLGAKYTDMHWQRNALHQICLDEHKTQLYRRYTTES